MIESSFVEYLQINQNVTKRGLTNLQNNFNVMAVELVKIQKKTPPKFSNQKCARCMKVDSQSLASSQLFWLANRPPRGVLEVYMTGVGV